MRQVQRRNRGGADMQTRAFSSEGEERVQTSAWKDTRANAHVAHTDLKIGHKHVGAC